MKIKMKFDKDAIVGFTVQHAEKLVFAVAVVCCAIIVYGAVQQKPYKKTPKEMEEQADRAQKHVKSTDPDAIAGSSAPPFFEIVSGMLNPMNEDAYRYKAAWHEDIFPKLRLRTKPPLLTVEELRGSAGRAPFGSAPARAAAGAQGQTVCGKRWIVITGLVPIKRQREAYDETFHNVREPNPQRDAPHYYYYWVERAEVNGPDSELAWTRLSRRRHKDMAIAEWGNEGHEVIEEKYLDPNRRLPFPLGPKVSEETDDIRIGGPHAKQGGVKSVWATDESVAHLPQIPLPKPEEPAETPAAPDPTAPGDIPPEDSQTLPDGNELPPDSRATLKAGRPAPVIRRPGMPATDVEEEEPEYWLFRFFDFKVEPGKSYRYRVQLVLENPNFDVPNRHLDPALVAEQERLIAKGKRVQYLTGNYSEPTGVIDVPRDYEVLLASVKAPLRSWNDPSVNMMVVKWVESCGKLAHHTQERVIRGNVLNYHMKWPPEKVTRSTGRDDARDDNRDDARGRTRDRAREDDAESATSLSAMAAAAAAAETPDSDGAIPVSYETEAVVLDIAGGGRRLPGRDVPGRVILLDSDGALVVCDELEDRPKVAARTEVLKEEEEPEEKASPSRRPGVRTPGTTARTPRGRPRTPATKPPRRAPSLDDIRVPP